MYTYFLPFSLKITIFNSVLFYETYSHALLKPATLEPFSTTKLRHLLLLSASKEQLCLNAHQVINSP